MKVVLADVQPEPLAKTADELRADGLDVVGVPTDVSTWESVAALRDATLQAFGAVHVVCNNAGIGAGAEGPMWEHELNDWAWAMAVNVWGVIHGINAFVPTMLATGDEGWVVNTSSGNGGVSPLSSTPQYAVTKAAVVTITECLYGQLADAGSKVGCSVLFPGPHILRTGLFESWRTRPEKFAKERPRQTPYTTVEALEEQMKAAGVDIAYTPVEEVAERVVKALHGGTFWIQPESDRTDQQIKARAESMLSRSNPDYLRSVPG
jgi:NAD(P)-dependent dehydrogenase (short-subunit alcohol dehydrogenase family)